MNRPKIFILLLIILSIESINSGLFLPLLEKIISSLTLNQGILEDSGNSTADILLNSGFVTILSPAFLIFAPIIGYYSDIYGRKKLLLLAIASAAIGYALIFLGVKTNNITIMIIGFIILSLSNIDLPIILALTTDISTSNNRSWYFALCFATTLLLQIAGQLGDKILQTPMISSTVQNINSLWLLVALELFNFILAIICLPETNHNHQSNPKVNLEIVLSTILQLFSFKNFRVLLVNLFIFYFVWGLYNESIFSYLTTKLSWSSNQATYFSWLEIGTILLVMLSVYQFLLKKYSHHLLLQIGVIMTSIGFICCAIFHTSLGQIIFIIPASIGISLAIPLFWSLLSFESDPTKQGLAMAFISISWVIAWMSSGFVNKILISYGAYQGMLAIGILSIIMLYTSCFDLGKIKVCNISAKDISAV